MTGQRYPLTQFALALAICATTSACLDDRALPVEAAEPKLDPVAFFTGRTKGNGTLSTLAGSKTHVSVSSRGTRGPGSELRLTQHIREGDKPARVRVWTIRPLAEGRYAGTLTDAVGPVRMQVRGNAMVVEYRTASYAVRQRLALGTNGKVHNRLDIDKWGLNVARLNETIVRQ